MSKVPYTEIAEPWRKRGYWITFESERYSKNIEITIHRCKPKLIGNRDFSHWESKKSINFKIHRSLIGRDGYKLETSLLEPIEVSND